MESLSIASSETVRLLNLVVDVIQRYRKKHHGQAPDLVYVSPGLHRQIVLDLPATVNGVTVCRSPRLEGISAAPQAEPYGLADLNAALSLN